MVDVQEGEVVTVNVLEGTLGLVRGVAVVSRPRENLWHGQQGGNTQGLAGTPWDHTTMITRRLIPIPLATHGE